MARLPSHGCKTYQGKPHDTPQIANQVPMQLLVLLLVVGRNDSVSYSRSWLSPFGIAPRHTTAALSTKGTAAKPPVERKYGIGGADTNGVQNRMMRPSDASTQLKCATLWVNQETHTHTHTHTTTHTLLRPEQKCHRERLSLWITCSRVPGVFSQSPIQKVTPNLRPASQTETAGPN